MRWKCGHLEGQFPLLAGFEGAGGGVIVRPPNRLTLHCRHHTSGETRGSIWSSAKDEPELRGLRGRRVILLKRRSPLSLAQRSALPYGASAVRYGLARVGRTEAPAISPCKFITNLRQPGHHSRYVASVREYSQRFTQIIQLPKLFACSPRYHIGRVVRVNDNFSPRMEGWV